MSVFPHSLACAIVDPSLQSFTENSALEGILADLVIPAVKRKELALREKGLVCLGLCCLIAKVSTIDELLWRRYCLMDLSLLAAGHGHEFSPAIPESS